MASPLKERQDKRFWNRIKKKTIALARFRKRGARGGKGRKK